MSRKPQTLSAGQEIPRLLWNPKVQYATVHTLSPYFLKDHFNIIISSTPRSSKMSPPFRLSNLNFVQISHPPCVLHARPLILLDLLLLLL
jgi:hypothetical protein